MIPPELVAWIREHRLEASWTPILHTTAAWIATSSPPWATTAERALACIDLGTCFFLLDDATDDVAPSRHDDLERMTTGATPDPGRPLQRAYADLFARLAALGPLDHYLATRRDFARALRRRHAVRTGARAVDVVAHVALRETTIYFGCWLSLWEVLGGFVLSPAQRALVGPAFSPANRWQVLENDRVSVARDARAGTPNVVTLVAAACGLSLAAASADVAARAAADLAAYRAASSALAAGDLEPPVRRYLAALAAGVDGAIRHYQCADPTRYDVLP